MNSHHQKNNALQGRWEQRYHPLRQEWIIVAGHRQDRPWEGAVSDTSGAPLPAYEPSCYLCPGNQRVGGVKNPSYGGTFVFDNDHPCVSTSAPTDLVAPTGIYRNRPAEGVSRVLCYSPRHDLTPAELSQAELENVAVLWQQQYTDLGNQRGIDYVLIFENKGTVVGVSNPHPHGQLYATNFVFKTIETEARVSARHFQETGRLLFQDILKAEFQQSSRIVCENDTAVAFIPYFGRYAYEVFVAPKATHPSIASLSDDELSDFVAILHEILIRFDNLWQLPFPYVMPLHQAPTDGGDYRHFHFHIEFHPPLRYPNRLKYLAGPEIGGGNFLSDTVPEEKAAELRNLPTTHYKQRSE